MNPDQKAGDAEQTECGSETSPRMHRAYVVVISREETRTLRIFPELEQAQRLVSEIAEESTPERSVSFYVIHTRHNPYIRENMARIFEDVLGQRLTGFTGVHVINQSIPFGIEYFRKYIAKAAAAEGWRISKLPNESYQVKAVYPHDAVTSSAFLQQFVGAHKDWLAQAYVEQQAKKGSAIHKYAMDIINSQFKGE